MIAIDNKRIARCHEDHQYVATEVRGNEYAVAHWDDDTNCVLESYYGPSASVYTVIFHRA